MIGSPRSAVRRPGWSGARSATRVTGVAVDRQKGMGAGTEGSRAVPAHVGGFGRPGPTGAARLLDASARREIGAFLDRLARAWSEADTDGIARCYAVPALVVTASDATAFATTDEIADGYRGVVTEHRRRGLVVNTHHVEAVRTLARGLHEVTVRWTHHDDRGQPRFHDSYRYLLRALPDGLAIAVVVVLGGPVPAPRR